MAESSLDQRLATIRERRIKAGRGGWRATADPSWGSEAQVWGNDGDPVADVHTSFTPHPDAKGDAVCAEAGDIAAFIASSHADVGELLATIARVRQRIADLYAWADRELITDDGFVAACVRAALDDVQAALNGTAPDSKDAS